MKPLLACLFLASIVGCATGAPPSSVERALYNVTTNLHTNVVPVAVIDSNRLVTATNWVTNVFATYQLHEREAVRTSIDAGGAVATGFGAPWLLPILGLLGAFYGGYAKFKNNQSDKRLAKSDALNTALAQGLEVAREVMKITSAPSVERNFVEKVKSAQVKADVKPEAAKVSSEKVDTEAAKDSAADVVESSVPVQDPVIGGSAIVT